jgi:hypothetical protein
MIKVAKMLNLPIENIKLVKGNRKVDEKHKENFKKRIVKRGFADTIKVAKRGNEYFAVEGQHRLRALVELGLSKVPCSIIDWVDVDDFDDVQSFIISLNDNNKRWILPDYVKSYADKGILEYVYLKKQMSKYDSLSPGLVATIYDGIKRSHDPLKSGKLRFINKEASDQIISVLNDMVNKWSKKKLPAQALRGAASKIILSPDPIGYCRAFKIAASNHIAAESKKKDPQPIPDGDDSMDFWFDNTVIEVYKALNNQ